MKVILFVGPKQSGKDTAADILKKKTSVKGKLSFAGPLKEICAAVTGLPIQYMHSPDLKEKQLKNPIKADRRFWRNIKKELTKHLPEVDSETGYVLYNIDRVSLTGLENRVFNTPRELLQQVGTDFIRDKVFKEWHLRAAFSDQTLAERPDGVYCVTDTRFVNELEFLQDKFGDDFTVYYIERPETEKALKEATHESELEILKVKELIPKKNIIKNDGTLEDFEKKVLKLKPSNKKGKSKKKKKTNRFVYGKAK